MAEVIIALSIVSSVITCLEMGSKVAERLEYHLSRTKSAPQIFGTLLDTLPLLLTTLEQIKDAYHERALDLESKSPYKDGGGLSQVNQGAGRSPARVLAC